MLTIRLTSDMTADEMAPLWPQVMRCFETYCARFPDDETPENMLVQCAKGRRQLWVVQDETGAVLLTPITEVVTVDATGKKRLICSEIGGERLGEAMPLLSEIEAWAVREHGVCEFELVGRDGWKRLLAPFGYEPLVRIYRKRIG